MVGDDQVGLASCPLGALDEAFPIMRAAGVDSFTAAVGESSRARPAE
jgi:hypothetical protein